MTMPPNRVVAARRVETTPMDSAERVPWVAYGLAAGGLGASCVALFFLLVDAVMGRAFWTPHALGAVLFRGEVPSVYAPPEPLLVIAYTAVHFAVFIGFATPAAFFVLARLPSTRGRGGAALVAFALFVAFEGVFLSLARLFAPELTGMLTAGRVATANALAAVAMSAFLYASVHRRRPRRRSGAHASKGEAP